MFVMKPPLILSIVVLLPVSCLSWVSAATAQPPAGKTLDVDAEKVFVLPDFESDVEIFNAATEKDLGKAKPLEVMVPVWLAREDAKWQASRLEISDEHVYHGRHSLKGLANVGSGHAWSPTVRQSFKGDWTGYDAIRFFAHSPEDKLVHGRSSSGWGTPTRRASRRRFNPGSCST